MTAAMAPVLLERQPHLAGAGARMPAGVVHQLTGRHEQDLGERIRQRGRDLAGHTATIGQMPSGAELLAQRLDGGHQAGLMAYRGSQLPHQRAQLGQRLIKQGSDLLETVRRPWLFLRREIDQNTGQHELLDGGVVQRIGKAASFALDRPHHFGTLLVDQEVGDGGHCSRCRGKGVSFLFALAPRGQ